MVLKFSYTNTSKEWTFADKIMWLTTNKQPLQEKDGKLTLQIRFRQLGESPEEMQLYFEKDDAVYLLNDDGKTIECLN